MSYGLLDFAVESLITLPQCRVTGCFDNESCGKRLRETLYVVGTGKLDLFCEQDAELSNHITLQRMHK